MLGSVKYGREIGKKEHGGKPTKYILVACVDCGKERWVIFSHHHPLRCQSCSCRLAGKVRGLNAAGHKNGVWKGGRHRQGHYIVVWVSKEDFFYSMANHHSYVPEHRLMMAKHLGRCLHRWEIVHHKNHNKDDNRIENLQLVTDDRHKQITLLETRIGYLEKRVTLLEAENTSLTKDMKVINRGGFDHVGERFGRE